MNQPDFYVKKIKAALDPRNTNHLDFMSLDPMCQPTDILVALYHTTAGRDDLSESEKIAAQRVITQRVATMKAEAGSMSDSDVALKIREISGT